MSGAARGAAFGDGAKTVGASGTPSKLTAGGKPSASPIRPRLTTASNVRITHFFGCPAGMGQRAMARRPYLLGVFPQIPGRELGLLWRPGFRPRLELHPRQFDLERAFVGVEHDNVAVTQKPDRASD